MIIKKYNFFFEKIYILLLGISTSFSLPPYNFWFINFFTFGLLIIYLLNKADKNLKTFFIYGYFFGFGYFISSMYWIPLSLLYDESFKFLIPIAIFIIPALLSLFYGFAFFIFKIFLKPRGVFVNILIFSLVLSIFEFLRGTILSGFPWNLFAYSFLENIKFIQINSIMGIYAFNMILITIFSTPSILFLNKKKNDILGFYLILLITTSNYVYGSLKINKFKNIEKEPLPAEIKILSTTIPIERFYSNINEDEILINLINLSNPIKKDHTIFIWPEGVVPNINLLSLKNEYDFIFKKSFSEHHTIILGINDYKIEKNEKKFYNSLSIIDNEANLKYKYLKNKLVPFGEFLPLERFLNKFGLKSITNNYQSYTAGSERKIYNYTLSSKIKILPLICYEIIYSGKLSQENDYNIIINISEDGWFGSSIGPYQHFAHSIFRSIESGKYTLRSANNGISAIVDPSGSVVNKISIDNEGVISLKEIANVDKTLFSIYGNKIYFLIILLYIFLIFSFKKMGNE